MKTGWTTKRLGDVCDFDKAQGVHRGLPYVGLEHIESNTGKFIGSFDPQPVKSSTFRFSTEHVLYGRLRPYLNKAIAPDFEGHCSTEIFPIKPTPSLSRDYLLYWLLADETMDRINGTCTGARMPRADMKEVLGFEIPVPPLAEQQRIVGVLDEAFAGLATAQAHTAKNLQNARALFESHLQSVFTHRGKGWVEKRKPLTDLCELIVDCEHKTAPTQELGIPSIRTPNIGKGRLLLDGVNRVSEETYKAWTRRAEPQAGDLILAREAPAGNVAVIPENTRVCLGQRTVLIRPNTTVFEPAFLAFLLLEPKTQAKLLANSRGATVQHVNMKDIRALDVGAIPSLDVQRSVVSTLWDLDAETQRLTRLYEQKQAALGELKKSLLHQAFTGEL
jgi:type I restriction enzyme S subunit